VVSTSLHSNHNVEAAFERARALFVALRAFSRQAASAPSFFE
jgi:hypothetical protein